MKTVYLAGPMEQWKSTDHFERDPSMPAKWRAEVMKRARRVKYVFPEQNEFMGHNHDIINSEIPKQDIELIKQCNLLVAFIDKDDRIGTFCEIAAAYALGKEIEIVTWNAPNFYPVPWFVEELSTNNHTVIISDEYEGFPTNFDEALPKVIDEIVELLGGDSLDYYAYILSPEWKIKADEAKALAGYRCQICNRSQDEITLDAHHRTYERLGKELPQDITVLCRDCHELYETNRKKRNRKR